MQFFQPQPSREVIPLTQAQQQSKFKTMFQTIGRFLMMLLTKQPELQVRVRQDASGRLWWTTYNPATGEIKWFWSYAQMLSSIRDRYLQRKD